MHTQKRPSSYQRYTRDNSLEDKKQKHTFTTQILICTLLTLFCILVKFYPDSSFDSVKNSIQLIVTHNTDFKKEFSKQIEKFKKEEEMEPLDPVSTMIPPSDGKIVQGFGMQDASSSTFHYGVDVAAEESKNIVAVNDGEVEEIAKNSEYGSYIKLSHSEEIFTLYGNLNEILVNVGDKVSKGQPIARADGGMQSFYFELRRGDSYLNPTEFIQFKE